MKTTMVDPALLNAKKNQQTVSQLLDKFLDTYSINEIERSNELRVLHEKLVQFKSEKGCNAIFNPEDISTQLIVVKHIYHA